MNPVQAPQGVALECLGLEKAFGSHVALAPLDLKVNAGEFLTILGPSGCGKTTLMRLLAGLEKPDAGRIRFGNVDVTELPTAQRDIALVFQLFTLYPHLHALDNLTFSLQAQGISKTDAAARAKEWLDRFRMGHLAKRRPQTMSASERQILSLCRALIRQPKLLLFDEPLSSLDASIRRDVWKGIRYELGQRGATTLFVTHDQEEAMAIGDRVAIMRDGKLEQCDIPHVLYDQPANLFVADFLGEPGMNLFPAMRRGEWVQLKSLAIRVKVHEGRKSPRKNQSVEKPCILGIRPEWVAISDTGAPVMVDHTAYLGSESLLHMRANGHPIRAWLPAGVRFNAKTTVHVNFMASACHCFDATTGERLPWRTLEVQCQPGA
jgi:ABC-type sugar transport system ATPase subunit